MIRTVLQKIRRFLYTQRYVIGFVEDISSDNPPENLFGGIQWLDLKGYKKGWFADPFILDADNEQIVVLAEEFLYSTNLGRIVKLTINRKTYALEKVDVILELPTHLSFPIYLKENGKTYVYPENYQGGALTLYEYDEIHNTLINPVPIIQEPLLDAQIVKLDGHYYVLGVKYLTGTQKDTCNLFIYRSDRLTGPYREFQRIENAKNEERGAGMIFITPNRELIRPIQSCEIEYGKEIIFSRLYFDGCRFSEIETKRIAADGNMKTGRGIHTFNTFNGLAVVDGRGFKYLLSRLIKSLLIFSK